VLEAEFHDFPGVDCFDNAIRYVKRQKKPVEYAGNFCFKAELPAAQCCATVFLSRKWLENKKNVKSRFILSRCAWSGSLMQSFFRYSAWFKLATTRLHCRRRSRIYQWAISSQVT
jgi:hypothetical protein